GLCRGAEGDRPSGTATRPGRVTRPPAGCMRCCGASSRRHPQGITAGQAARFLDQITPASVAAQARGELAAAFLEDLRRLDAQLRETQKKLAAAVKASGTSLTGIFGAGPVIADTVIGDVRHVSRFPDRDHFAACNGTAPIEVSSGDRKTRRLSLRGNRRLNHAIHMAAITQIRHGHSDGRAYYERKIAEGKTHKEALRSLKRQISNAIYAALLADARQAAASSPKGPGGQPGNRSVSRAAGSHPERQLFGQATPGPHTTLRPGPGSKKKTITASARKTPPPQGLDSKAVSFCTGRLVADLRS